MEFMSPRFAGSPLLQQILDDPDTGTLKLQPGSPAEAVQPVQRALLDLRWPAEVVPPVPLAGFDDGVFGTNTQNTAVTYKRCFRVVFPGSPTIDGFVGPRTLWLLDKHITWYDSLLTEVDAKIAELQATGSTVTTGEAAKAIRQAALKRDVTVDGVAGAVFISSDTAPVLVRSPILDAYLDRVRAFGAPVSDEEDGPDGTRQQSFAFGTLRHDPVTGQVFRVDDEVLPDLVF
jgi:hypothetical protein